METMKAADLARFVRRGSRSGIAALVFLVLTATHVAAQSRFIVRTQNGVDGVQTVKSLCAAVGCAVQYPLDGDLTHLFLVTTATNVDGTAFLSLATGFAGIADAEVDGLVRTQGGSAGSAPTALMDREPLTFFGTTVWRGYVEQPATQIQRIRFAQEQYGLSGRAVIVAVIDTGVDPAHPALKDVVAEGYDFTRNSGRGSEREDIDRAAIDHANAAPMVVNQSTMAVVDQSTMAVVDTPEHAAFGHGTMVAGIIHLVAPRATILPLKAFRADGGGYSSDILRSVYFAVRAGAKVLNLSFSYATPSRELERALTYASDRGSVAVSSVGNEGKRTLVYPAALRDVVIGVASTSNDDKLSGFSNYGTDIAWIAAPGEAVVTPYPFGSYAAAWGTSFSAPFASGAAALLAEMESRIRQSAAAESLGTAVWISSEVVRGRLDVPYAIARWRSDLGR